jgi:hypothetical protein
LATSYILSIKASPPKSILVEKVTREATMLTFWHPPSAWTVETANLRAFQVFSNPLLSEFNLPAEAGLLFHPKPPQYPDLVDSETHKPIVVNRASGRQKLFMKDIPWLPCPFNMDTPGWKLNLYQIFGATCRDMVDRVDPKYEESANTQFLSNRLVKRSSDYRALFGGFCTDYKAFKNGMATNITVAIVKGDSGKKRDGLTMEQVFFVSSLLLCSPNVSTDPSKGCDLGHRLSNWYHETAWHGTALSTPCP